MEASAETSAAAVRAVLLAYEEGRPSPFERWLRDERALRRPPVSADELLAQFLRLNGGAAGLRRLTREGLSSLYLQQLERTLGEDRSRTAPPPVSREPDETPTTVELPAAPEAAAPVPAVPLTTPPVPAAPVAAASLLPATHGRGPRSGTSVALQAAALLACAGVGVSLLVSAPEPVDPGRSARNRPSAPPPAPPPAALSAQGHGQAGEARTSAEARGSAQRPRAEAAAPASPPPVAAVAKPKARIASAPLRASKHIHVNVARRRIEISENGRIVRVLANCSFGRAGHRTPMLKSATLSLKRRERLHHSLLYDGAPMPYALFLDQAPNVAFHAGSTSAQSHGCIHLRRKDARWLFDWAAADRVSVDIQPA